MTMTMGPIVISPVRRLFSPKTWFAPCTYLCDKCHKETPVVVGIDYVGFLCNECVSSASLCEGGCGPATTRDNEGVPLCDKCVEMLRKEGAGDE